MNSKMTGFYQCYKIDKKTNEKVFSYYYVEENDIEVNFYSIHDKSDENIKSIMAKFARDNGYTKDNLHDMFNNTCFKTNLDIEQLGEIVEKNHGYPKEDVENLVLPKTRRRSGETRMPLGKTIKEKITPILSSVKNKWKNSKLIRRITYGAGIIALIWAMASCGAKLNKDNTPTSKGPQIVKPVDDDELDDTNNNTNDNVNIEEQTDENTVSNNRNNASNNNSSTNNNNQGNANNQGFQDPSATLPNNNPSTSNPNGSMDNVYEEEGKTDDDENYDQTIEVPSTGSDIIGEINNTINNGGYADTPSADTGVSFDDKYTTEDGKINGAVSGDISTEQKNPTTTPLPSPDENAANMGYYTEDVPVYQNSRSANDYASVIVQAMEEGKGIVYNAENGTLSVDETANTSSFTK